MPTRSPIRSPSTPAPIASIQPTISWPRMIGRRGSGSSPSTTCKSVRQTPQAETLTRISPGPGFRSARSLHSNAVLSFLSTIACMAASLFTVKVCIRGRARPLDVFAHLSRVPLTNDYWFLFRCGGLGLFVTRFVGDEIEDNPTRDLSVLEPVEDVIDCRQRLQLNVSLDLAISGKGQGFGHILSVSDKGAADGDAVRDHIK